MNTLATNAETDRVAELRETMVREQLEHRGIHDPRVLAAMRRVPRERFVLAEYQSMAYDDGPLPIGHQQTISQPYIVAFMTEALDLKPRERVLEIGTGSGYQAAILAEMGMEVFSIEILEPLARRAEKTLADLGYSRVQIKVGNGYEGWTEYAPFEAIIVTAAPEKIPSLLVEQLKLGGRMIVPVGVAAQDLLLIQKTPKGIKTRSLLPVRFVPMVEEIKKEK